MAATYPHQFWERTAVPADAPETGCTIAEADALLECVEPACGEEPPENLASCVLGSCGTEFNATSGSCQSCLAANLGQPLDSILLACRGVSKGGIVYDGHNGLAVVSKHPIQSADLMPLDYALTARALLHAEIDLPATGPTDVYCTHLAADLSNSIAYPEGGAYTSFVEENAAQTATLLAAAATAVETRSVALLGDFNHGPARGSFEAELPENHASVLAAGWADPLSTLEPPQCTFCERNLLLGGTGAGGTVIDHVYLKTTSDVLATEIVFDQPVPVVGADGQPKDVNLSDHFGLAVTLEGSAGD